MGCVPGGGCLPGGRVSAQGGVCWGLSAQEGVYTFPPWTEFLTHACEKNITFQQLLLWTVKKKDLAHRLKVIQIF